MSQLPYHPINVGKLIAVGGEHVVRRYGEGQVIKFGFGPWYFLRRKQFCDNLRRDTEIIKRHFTTYLLDREIHFYSLRGKPSYVIIEPFVVGRHLRRADLGDADIFDQFREIVFLNRQMMKEDDISIEFFGTFGLLFSGRREVSNIMIERDSQQLYIVDAGALHFGRHKEQGILSTAVTKWALATQERLLRYYEAATE